MKTRARLLSVVLAAVMVIGSAIPAFAAPAADEYHVELDQVGSFSKEGIETYYNAFLEVVSDNEAYVYDMNGKKIFNETVKSVDYLERGIYQFTKANTTDVNSNALVDADGKVLLPFEAAFYSWPGEYDNKTQKRFILAYYGTEETDDTSDYLFYTTEDMFAIGEPGKDDTLYKGYAKIYDIQNNKFVDGLQFEHIDKYETINIVGNSILVKNEDETYTLYNAEGKKLLDLNSRIDTTDNIIIERSETNSGCRVYDENGTEIFKSGKSIYPLSTSTGNYLYYSDYSGSSKYVILDEKGNEILTSDKNVYEEDCDIFKVKGDGPYIFIDKNGKELGQTEGSTYSAGYGRFFLETGVNTYTLIGPSGTLAEEVTKESYFYTKDGSIICLNDGTGFLTYDENARYTVKGYLLFVSPGYGEAGAVYDLFTGKKLVDDGVYEIKELGDRIVLEYHDGPDYTYKTVNVNVVEGK